MASRLRAAISAMTTVSPPREPAKHFETSSVGFAIWWVILFSLHGVNVAYYVTAANLYYTLQWSNVAFQLETYAIGINPDRYQEVSVIHAIVAAVHVLCMVSMIVGSLQARRHAFQPNVWPWIKPIWVKMRSLQTKKSEKGSQRERSNSIVRRLSTHSIVRRASTLTDLPVAYYHRVFGRTGFFGVDSVYFDHLHLGRELLETTLQLIQVYRMTYLLPRVWLIRFYVLLLIVNCWSTPLVHRYYGNRHTQRRMMSLLCDAVLDMVSSIGVSLWIFATYAPQYTDPAFGFPFDQWFDDVWFTNMQQEFQMMVVVSWADMASRLVFAFGLLQCMEMIKELLEPVESAPENTVQAKKLGSMVNPTTSGHVVEEEKQDKVIEPTSVRPKVEPIKPEAKPVTRSSRIAFFLVEKAGPALFVTLGLAIFIVHIVSETRQTSADIPCQLTLHPWFVNKPSCSLVELDCHQLGGISGSQVSMQRAWKTFEFGATARIFVRHCPELEMPPTIQQFRQVTAVKLYNSTIASWSEEAALNDDAHANMRAIFAIRTDFPNGELPPGLLTTRFPKGLLTFVTSATNLRTLPEHIDEVWPVGMTLVFELSQLQVIPPSLIRLNPSLISVAGTAISEVPTSFFENPLLECVLLSYTQVQELPRNPQHVNPGLYLMLLEGTNVSTFWSWMEPFVHESLSYHNGFFNAHGSRYCSERNEIVASNRTSFSITTVEPNARDLSSEMDVSSPAALQFAVDAVVCEPGFPLFFSLPLQDAWSAIPSQ